MKVRFFAVAPLLFLAAPLTGFAVEQLIPAGSLVQCTVSEPKLSSKTTDIGDPVLCQVSHVELYGRSVFPYGSYMVGHFEDYKDPGHLWGKGWMELKFDRIVIPPDTVIPLAAKVVYVPKYPVDKQGRIHGNGHPVRDTVEWMIPVLWPIDLINLPRRGPRPVLKPETRLTLKIMDDLGVPLQQQATYTPYPYPQSAAPRDPYGFAQRPPISYAPPPQQPYGSGYATSGYGAPPPQPVYTAAAPVRPPYTMLVFRGGSGTLVSDYWFENGGRIRYIATNGAPVVVPAEMLDVAGTVEVNRRRGVEFTIRSAAY